MERTIFLSLIITALHVACWDGMILCPLAQRFALLCERMHLQWLTMPVYSCLICMGGIWTLILYPLLFGLDWFILPTALAVVGLNAIISAVLKTFHDYD